MTGDRDDERPRDRTRREDDRGFGFGIGAGIRALRDLLENSVDRRGSRSWHPDRRSRRRKRYVPERSGEREAGGRTRTKRIRVTGPDVAPIDTRRADGAFVVTADVVGIDPGDLSVCVDHGADDLVLAEDGRVVERVDLPWRSVDATDVRLNNGVLEVRLRPSEDPDT